MLHYGIQQSQQFARWTKTQVLADCILVLSGRIPVYMVYAPICTCAIMTGRESGSVSCFGLERVLTILQSTLQTEDRPRSAPGTPAREVQRSGTTSGHTVQVRPFHGGGQLFLQPDILPICWVFIMSTIANRSRHRC